MFNRLKRLIVISVARSLNVPVAIHQSHYRESMNALKRVTS